MCLLCCSPFLFEGMSARLASSPLTLDSHLSTHSPRKHTGDRLTRAAKVLQELAEDQVPVMSKARITIRTFSIRRNEEIACHVTLRGDLAMKVLTKALAVKDGELKAECFSTQGHFGFGIDEHIDLDLKYDPAVGIYGMDLYCVLTRPGFRVAHKKRKGSRIGLHHRITKEDAQKWFLDTFPDSRIR